MNNMEELKLENIIRYWRQSCLDIQLFNLSYVKLTHEELVDKPLLAQGKLPPEITQRLFMRTNHLLQNEFNSLETIPLLIAPFLARPRIERQSYDAFGEETALTPLWIPVTLTWEGELKSRSLNNLPWISRNLLDPSPHLFHLGKLIFLEQFIQEMQLPRGKNGEITWHELYSYAQAMLDAASLSQWQNLLAEAGYDLLNVAMIKISHEAENTLNPMIKLYDSLLSTTDLPALFKNILNNSHTSKQPLVDLQKLHSLTHLHLAHFSKQSIPVAFRKSLYGILNLPKDNTLAVNAAPGSEYAQILRIALSSFWVQAAIANETPPISVWIAKDSKSLWQVIQDFNQSISVARWLPEEINGYAAYIADSDFDELQAMAVNFQWVHERGSELTSSSNILLNENFIKKAQQYFLRKCNIHLHDGIQDLSQAIEAIQAKIKQGYSLLQDGIANANHLHNLSSHFIEQYQGLGKFSKLKKELEKQLQELVETINELVTAEEEWQKMLNSRGWFFKAFNFLPIYKRAMAELRHELLEKYAHLKILKDSNFGNENTTFFIHDILTSLLHDYSTRNLQLAEMHQLDEEWLAAQQEWFKWLDRAQATQVSWMNLSDFDDAQAKLDKTNLLNWLDLAIRPLLFEWTVHYWEASWLKEIQAIYESTNEIVINDQQFWRLQTMLSPCLVADSDAAIRIFSRTQDGAISYNLIDNLILDGADQFTPESAAGLFALAKKLIAVGDPYQAKPPAKLLQIMDRNNAKKFALANNSELFQQLIADNIAATGSSILGLVEKISAWQFPIAENTFSEQLLIEQQDISPTMLKFCKELIPDLPYKISSGLDKVYNLPNFGIINVTGEEQWLGTDCQNEEEAKHMVMWLTDHYQLIADQAALKYPGVPLQKLIQIVTPFTRQCRLLQRLIQQNKIPISLINTFETIASLPVSITLFSPVYTYNQNHNLYLFDQTPRSFYTLGSHTRDCILIFGDKRIFDTAPSELPSAILAKHLHDMPYFYELKNLTDIKEKQ